MNNRFCGFSGAAVRSERPHCTLVSAFSLIAPADISTSRYFWAWVINVAGINAASPGNLVTLRNGLGFTTQRLGLLLISICRVADLPLGPIGVAAMSTRSSAKVQTFVLPSPMRALMLGSSSSMTQSVTALNR